MNITRAFSILFEDRDWLNKLVIVAIVTLVTAILSPALVGLAGWAMLLGYMIDIIRNVRAGSPSPYHSGAISGVTSPMALQC